MRKIYSELTHQELTLHEKCTRVISFSPAITETIFELGLDDILLGVSAYCVHPEKAKEKIRIGSYNNFNEKLIDSINPELCFTTTGYQHSLINKLKNKFPVYPIRLPITVSDVISFCTEVGIVLGYYEKARLLERILIKEINDVIDIDEKESTDRIKVYIEIDLGGPITFGAYSYITDAIRLVGGRNIFENEPFEWLVPNYDRVKNENPGIIIYEPRMYFKRKSFEEVFSLFKDKLNDVNAIKNKNFFITPGPYDFLAHHGPGFIKNALPWLKQIIKKAKST